MGRGPKVVTFVTIDYQPKKMPIRLVHQNPDRRIRAGVEHYPKSGRDPDRGETLDPSASDIHALFGHLLAPLQ